MNIFDQGGAAPFGGGMGLRDEAERYAASLGLQRGTQDWGAAIRDFVLNGPGSAGGGGAIRTLEERIPAQAMPWPEGPASGPGGLPPMGAMPPLPAGGLPPGAGGAGPLGQAPAITPLAQGGAPQDRSLFRAPAGPARTFDALSGGEGRPEPAFSSGFGGGGEERLEPREPRELAQLQEGGQSFRRGPPGGGRPVQRPAQRPPTAEQERPLPPGRTTPFPGGRLSRQYEVGPHGGPGTVSTGQGDGGGVSYGSYQLATRPGTAQAFVDSPDAARWSRELRGLRPGTAEFSQRWREIAAREPEAFEQAQHDFIGRTHYAPAVDNVRRRTGVDFDTMAPAVRDAVWSVSVQHGGAPTILRNAVTATDARMRGADGQVDRTSPAYQRAMIEEIYDARTDYVRDVAIPRAAPANRAGLRNAIRTRYPEERRNALRLLDEDNRTP